MYPAKPLSQDKGSETKRKGEGVSTRYVVLGRRALPDTLSIPKHTWGQTQVWGRF